MEQTLSSMQTLLIWSLIEIDVDEPDKVKLYQINIFSLFFEAYSSCLLYVRFH